MAGLRTTAPRRGATTGAGVWVIAAAALLAGCANLAPDYERPLPPVAPQWPTVDVPVTPVPPATPTRPTVAGATVPPTLPASGLSAPASAADQAGARTAPVGSAADAIAWRDFITDARLRRAVELSLARNRDLRVAALNIEQARAQYRIQRAALLPTVNAGAYGSRQRTPASTSASGQATTSTLYAAEVGLSSYELDLFGRVRNLGESALQSFYAIEANRRSTQISLVAEVASAWLTLAADTEQLRLARETLASQQASYDLTRRTRELGGTSGLALAQAQTTVDTARGDVARFTTLVAQDRNALELLAGGPLPDEVLPAASGRDDLGEPAAASLLVDVPTGLPSEVLQRRPDVVAAEHLLRAANADIGVARAALFPSISLTASAGTQSRSLSDLFGSGTGAWSFVPRIDLPIFDAGQRRASVQVSEAQRDIEVANYERTLQVAFREVADALALRGSLAEQLAAQQSLVQATQRSFELSEALFKNGANSYLEVLDAQRSLYAARQDAINLRLTEQANRIALYRVLGGGWGEADALANATP